MKYLFSIVDCEWSKWSLQKQCDKKCGSGFEVYRRKKILTESLRELGYTSCKGMDDYEDKSIACKGKSTAKSNLNRIESLILRYQTNHYK